MSLPGRLSAPTFWISVYWLLLYAGCTMATSFYSLASASFAHGLWSPVIVIRAVGYDRMVWALCESVQRAPSQPGTVFHLVWVSCFPPLLFCNSPATALASSPSCPLTFLTPLSVLQSWYSGVPYPHSTVSVWSYQNCPSESLSFAIHKCLELSGSKKS